MKNDFIAILGGGESGVGAAILAQKKGYEVFVSDNNNIAPEHLSVLQKKLIPYEQGVHTEAHILQATLVIKSPGIPDDIPLIQKIEDKGIPIIDEVEFAYRYTNAFIISVTGSNGKTTTVQLLYNILSQGGLKVALAGNVGNSFARMVAEQDYDYFVLELSSFQLDRLYTFRSNIAILTNITADHLNRYQNDLSKYIAAKWKILNNMTAKDFFLYCEDDPISSYKVNEANIKPRVIPFSQNNISINKNTITLKIKTYNKNFTMPLNNLALRGKHNAYNSLAAAIPSLLLGIRSEVIRKCFSDYRGIEHRLESVAKLGGIEYINDSKATNINATWYALDSTPGNVIWIVGGEDKGNDYSVLDTLVREKVKAIICLGKNNGAIINAFRKSVSTIIETSDMKSAVKSADLLAESNDIVLLSPACASYDLFNNYKERGKAFKREITQL